MHHPIPPEQLLLTPRNHPLGYFLALIPTLFYDHALLGPRQQLHLVLLLVQGAEVLAQVARG